MGMVCGARHLPMAVSRAPRTTMITQVRMKVARSLSMSLMPTLAKIAVRAANTAATSAQNCQLAERFITLVLEFHSDLRLHA
jgi:hypothetical protein